MKTEIKEIYRCDHCNKLYLRKHATVNHEKVCSKNTDNFRKCLDGCVHLIKKDAKVYIGVDDYYSGEPYYWDKSLLYCDKKKTFLYPPKSEHKNNFFTEFEDENNENNPMPKECDLFWMQGK